MGKFPASRQLLTPARVQSRLKPAQLALPRGIIAGVSFSKDLMLAKLFAFGKINK